jgi:hypothetical protein
VFRNIQADIDKERTQLLPSERQEQAQKQATLKDLKDPFL